ncbi:metallophosphoesterase [archaeon]|nr:metallophosphoesterase [archaeon]
MIDKNIEIRGLGLFIKRHKMLVVSDFHLGFEEYLREKGILVPRQNLEWIIRQLKEILKKIKPKIIVVNGDLKHEFGKVSRQEWKECFEILYFLKKNCRQLILVKGNHDVAIKPILRRFDVKIMDYLKIGSIMITHGHKLGQLNLKNVKVIITAHEHPAFEVSEGIKKEKFKAYYAGKWKGKKLIMQPSFNMLSIGSKPRLKFKIERVYAVGDRIYEFEAK